MADLIERSAAIEWVEHLRKVDKLYHPYAKSDSFPLSEVIDTLNRIPAVDAVPVVHGRWVDEFRGDDHYVVCSKCRDEYIEEGLTLASWVRQYFKFCPNCGAKMDGKDEA